MRLSLAHRRTKENQQGGMTVASGGSILHVAVPVEIWCTRNLRIRQVIMLTMMLLWNNQLWSVKWRLVATPHMLKQLGHVLINVLSLGRSYWREKRHDFPRLCMQSERYDISVHPHRSQKVRMSLTYQDSTRYYANVSNNFHQSSHL